MYYSKTIIIIHIYTILNPLYTGGGAIWPPLLKFFGLIIFGFYMGTLIGLLMRVAHEKFKSKYLYLGK